ncbi:hypothetical protein BCR35DRAFT_262684 [Leucosporidium creatinivorum]|uniref:Cytidyltransferase-like domain-containing protein n=1 Tax=Leucosporidium creatinivorum TaxID=106004 RepID=A0A1Y2G030_9BASI|nr:hypothetical protein BCR35DRAFT_262684 [Leucosporidium creatinivorum]
MRGLGVCVPEGVECVRIEVQQEEGEQEGKGKGVAVDTEEEHRPKQYKDKDDKPTPNQHSPSFPVTALGGTFDHLHAGHKILLTMAASVTTRKIIVGVTDEALLVNKKHHTYLESLPHRIHAVESFLSLIRPTIEHEVVPISDPFGPTAHDPDIQGLVVSEETRSGGSAINTKRLALSPPLNELETLVIELIADDGDAESEEVGATVDVARKMGSTGIRGWLAARDEKEGKREGEGAE